MGGLRSSMIGAFMPLSRSLADVFERGFGDVRDAAARHGARHLRHAAGALGDAEHLDARQRAALGDGAGVALDAAKVDGDLRSRHFFTQGL